jgi:dihydroxy-acid dehydratase
MRLVIHHVSPEVALGQPIALIQNGDTTVMDVNHDTLDCSERENAVTLAAGTLHAEAEHKCSA